MNPDLETIFKDLKQESLDDGERIRMRNELSAFMSQHPAKAPLYLRMLDGIESWLAAPTHASFGRIASAALALVLVVGVGTSYAAENALPGDLLYPIKVNVNEAVVGTLAVSQSAKAQWNATQVSRRLEEAEKLASENRLTPIARAQIEMQINETARNFDTSVAALAKADDTSAVAAVQTDLEASLNGHEQVLAALSDDASAGTSLAPILSTVRAQAVALASANDHVDSLIASATPAVARAAALQQKSDASASIGRIHASIAAKKTSDDDSDDADEGASIAATAMRTGDKKLDEGDYGEAFTAFQTALRVSKTAEVHLDATTALSTTSTSSTSTATTTTATTSSSGSDLR